MVGDGLCAVQKSKNAHEKGNSNRETGIPELEVGVNATMVGLLSRIGRGTAPDGVQLPPAWSENVAYV